MLIRSLPLLLAASSTVSGLKDALPFLLLSTESIDTSILASQQIASPDTLRSSLRQALESCDASQYIFVEHPGLRASDLSDSSSMPLLAKRMGNEQYKSVVQVPEVVGKIGLVQLEIELEEKCGRERVSHRTFPLIAEKKEGKARMDMVQEADAILDKDLHSMLSNHTSHVLIFSSVPVDEDATELELLRYDMEMDEPPFQEHMHTDLKRDVPHEFARRQASGGDNFQDGLPLFEKYQFLSPGIFMGLFVSLMLLLILYVGISAIAGLEVSYMAFSKEMGPQAQKKQQ